MSTATLTDTSTWDRVRHWSPPSRTGRSSRRWPCSSACSSSGGIRYEGFASPQVVLNLFIDNAFLIVLAVGMTFVILTGGHRPVGRLGRRALDDDRRAHAGGGVVRRGQSMAAVLLTGTALGLLMGLVIHYFDIQPFIATLAGHVPGPRSVAT